MKPTLTVEETAEILGVCRSSAYAAIHSGEIDSFTIGGRILVPTAALERKLGLPAGALINADGVEDLAP